MQIRNELIDLGWGSKSIFKSIMELYVGSLSEMTSFSYSTVSTQLENDRPIYTEWRTDDRDGHCMVIRGYYFDTELIGPATRSISLMDPNRTTYQLFAGADESMILGYNIGSDTYYYEYANY